jgi:hypothetical protein
MTYPDPLFEPGPPPATFAESYPPAEAAAPAAAPDRSPPAAAPDRSPSGERRPVEPPPVRPDSPTSGGTRTVPPAHRAYRPGGASDPEHDAMQRQIDRAEALRRANKDFAVGALWLVGGVLVTLFTMTSDSPVYVIAWGPMLYGLYRIVKGAVTFVRNRG